MAGMAVVPVATLVAQPTGTWQAWNWVYNNGYSTSSTTLTNAPWQAWNSNYCTTGTTSTTLIIPQWQTWNFQYEESAAQRATREAEYTAFREQHAQEREQYRVARLAATSRAEELLLALLNDEQARTYREHGWFEVRGSRGGRYRIRNRGQAGNVDLMPEIGSERDVSYCCHPPGALPDADAHVAQLLHLVTDEDDFKRVANIAYRRPGLLAVA